MDKKRVLPLVWVLFAVSVFSYGCCCCFSRRAAPAPREPAVRYERGRPEVYLLDKIKTVAVLGFEDSEFTEHFDEKIFNNSQWKVIGRIRIESIFAGMGLDPDARFDDDTAVEAGKLAGADMVIFGTYRGRSAAVRAVEVATGEHLVYRVLALDASRPASFHAEHAATAFLPHTIKIVKNRPDVVWIGPRGDSTDNK